MRVLLIEDDSNTAQSIELMLKSERFNFYTTDLGKKVSISASCTITTSSCSISTFPTCPATRFFAWLRVSKVKTPILILTGLGGIEDKVRGLGYGATYMTKPFHKSRAGCAHTRHRAPLQGTCAVGGSDWRPRRQP